MRSWVIGLTAALVLLAAFLLLRGGSPEGDEAKLAHRGAGSAARSAADERDGSHGSVAGGNPLSSKAALPSGGGAAEKPGSVRDGGSGGEKGSAVVIPGAGKAGIQVGQGGVEGAAGGAVEVAGGAAKAGGVDTNSRFGPGGEQGGAGEHGSQTGDGNDAGAEGPGDVVFTSDEGKQYMTNEPVDLPDSDKLSRDAGSVNFWLEPGWEGDNQDDADFIDLGDGGLRVVKNVNYLRFEYIDANGVEGGVGVEITDWKVGEARQVTATWDGSSINLYVDGKLVSQRPNPGLQRSDDPGPVIIGSAYPPDRPIAPGVLSQVQLFNRPLFPSEIGSIQRKTK